jgi:hypothetical protein
MLGISIIVTADPDLTLSKFTGILLGLTVWRIYAHRLTNQNSLMIGILIFILVGLGFTALGVMNAEWQAKVPLIAQFTQKLPPALMRLPEAVSVGIQPNQVAGTILLYLPLLYSEAALLTVLRAAWLSDRGEANNLEASVSKAKGGTAVRQITQGCIDLLGPIGISREHLIEKWFRDVRITDIYEGTGQIQHLIIARTILGYGRKELN